MGGYLMSIVNAGNTTTTAYIVTGDTSGNLTFQSVGSNVVTMNASSGIIFNDGSSINSHAAPNVTTYTSGSGTYTTPTGAKWLVVQVQGGGGGAGGGGTASSAGVGGNGNTSTFGTSLLIAYGGYGGQQPAVNGISAQATGGDINTYGTSGVSGTGTPSTIYQPGGTGGAGFFGGGGAGGYTVAGQNGGANTGGGGGGGGISSTSSAYTGGGGGGGSYCQKTISSPSSTYSYAVGAGGTAGAAGTNGSAGGAGGSGLIIVTAYF